jgi:hypothetical protein
MGTRNLTIVQSSGEYKIAQYCQWDGQPSGQGVLVLNALTKIFNAGGLQRFQNRVDALKQVSKDYVKRKRDEIIPHAIGTGQNQEELFKTAYPHYERSFGAKILEAVYDGEVENVFPDIEFAAESLVCEWAYVIDLDTGMFEIYTGFNETPLKPSDRFNFLDKPDVNYHPVKLFKEWPLNCLPTEEEFLELERILDEKDEAEEAFKLGLLPA